MTVLPSLCGINAGSFNGFAVDDCERVVRVAVQGSTLTTYGRARLRQHRVRMLMAPRTTARPSPEFVDYVDEIIALRQKQVSETLRVTMDATRFLMPGESFTSAGHSVLAVSGTPVSAVERLSNGPFKHTVDYLVSGGSDGSVSDLQLSWTTNMNGRYRARVRIRVRGA